MKLETLATAAAIALAFGAVEPVSSAAHAENLPTRESLEAARQAATEHVFSTIMLLLSSQPVDETHFSGGTEEGIGQTVVNRVYQTPRGKVIVGVITLTVGNLSPTRLICVTDPITEANKIERTCASIGGFTRPYRSVLVPGQGFVDVKPR